MAQPARGDGEGLAFHPGRFAARNRRRARRLVSHTITSPNGDRSMYSNLILEVQNGVAHLTLNRPEPANGINLEMAADLDHAARKCDDDPAVRAILISGAGKFICAGGDLKSFAAKSETDLPRYLEEVTSHLHRAVSLFARMRSPVIAAVHGSAAGAGFSLTCAVDFVIATESAKFTMAYTKAGLTPDGSSTFYLPRIVGPRRALELAI